MTADSAPMLAKGFHGKFKSPIAQLGDVVTLHYGKALAAPVRRPGNIPVYGSNGQCGWHDVPLRQGPTVVLGRKGKGPLGVKWCSRPFWVIDTAYYVSIDPVRIDLRYFYYLTGYIGLNHLKDGTSNPSLRRDVFCRQAVPLPDLPTQRKIAGILSAYDDLIENNLRRIKILEQMAQSLYREWFVYFRFPGHESVKFVDSSLGPIPKGWEVKAIEEVAIVHRGRSYRSSELLDDGGLPFINLKCVVRDGGFRRDGIKCFDGPYKDSHKVVPGDIVMAVTDMTQERRIVARAARIPTLDADFGIVSMDLVKIEPRLGVSSDYLYGYFRCSDFADHLKQHANGANVLHLSPDRIKEHQFIMPDEQLRNRYSVTAGLHFEKIENLHRRNDILRRTRDLLLPKLLSAGN